MVLAQIGKDEAREPRAQEPLLHGAVRGRLERAAAVPGLEHLAERPLQVDRLWRRAARRAALATDAALDRAEQARPPLGSLEDAVEEEARRRLAVRAGDRCDLELVG